jgi:hypothetical protein
LGKKRVSVRAREEAIKSECERKGKKRKEKERKE